MYSIYSYPVDATCSSHYARDNIIPYIFFSALSSIETKLYLLDGWLLLVFLTILHQLEKDNNNNNEDSDSG